MHGGTDVILAVLVGGEGEGKGSCGEEGDTGDR